ncbi:hepatitis A virus cellular receptor 1 homolog isoform X2 [Echeneis naucrates]|uniref:hepatitis A virus cellular receptor 1 homolog isoform X2 n=1 Tax=Echeneis naucrates TaxID=173247 RepID=UPI001113E347|nr:hepatitis A virus cellular receptor 1 homolog isoform X2 [Echeneis naucrates]
MGIALLLALFSVASSDGSRFFGRTGENITLPCKYNKDYYGALFICWGRGKIPNSGCNNQIISTDGHRETNRVSSRYQLGQLEDGDVSLTILNLTDSDGGLYGCRVEIPGLFNDNKHQFEVTVERAPQTTTSSDVQMSTLQTAGVQTPGYMTTINFLTSSPNIGLTAEETSSMYVALLCVLLGLTILVTVGGALILAAKWRRQNKMPPQPLASTLQLQTPTSAVENIYQMDEGGDYEFCP